MEAVRAGIEGTRAIKGVEAIEGLCTPILADAKGTACTQYDRNGIGTQFFSTQLEGVILAGLKAIEGDRSQKAKTPLEAMP